MSRNTTGNLSLVLGLALYKLARRADELETPMRRDVGSMRRLAAPRLRAKAQDQLVEKANEKLIEADRVPLPPGLTPHKLRHTFASILVALGTDVGAVMDQLGHEDAGFTLRVYRHGMRRDERSQRALAQLVGGESKRHRKGTSASKGMSRRRSEGTAGAETAR